MKRAEIWADNRYLNVRNDGFITEFGKFICVADYAYDEDANGDLTASEIDWELWENKAPLNGDDYELVVCTSSPIKTFGGVDWKKLQQRAIKRMIELS